MYVKLHIYIYIYMLVDSIIQYDNIHIGVDAHESFNRDICKHYKYSQHGTNDHHRSSIF